MINNSNNEHENSVPRQAVRPLVEICVETAEAAGTAKAGGAERVELCSEVACGGLTPPTSEVLAALEQAPEAGVQVLVRSRPGDFVFSSAEVSLMLDQIWEIQNALCTVNTARLVGFVFGAVKPTPAGDRVIDEQACRLVRDRTKGRELTFHRAFDQITDQVTGIRKLADLGFNRVLTTGGHGSVAQPEQLSKLIEIGDEVGVTVLVSGGLRSTNIAEIAQRIPLLTEVHMRTPYPDGTGTDLEEVRKIISELDKNCKQMH